METQPFFKKKIDLINPMAQSNLWKGSIDYEEAKE